MAAVQDDGCASRDPCRFCSIADWRERNKKLDEGDINGWILNQVMAPNPFVRYLMSMMYLSNVNGLSKINYPKSEFMKRINFEELKKDGKPLIFHNAWNLDKQKLALFSNRPIMTTNPKDRYEVPINATHFVRVFGSSLHRRNGRDRQRYILRRSAGRHGQLRSLLEEHPDLEEIWVSRIVDSKQIRKPENLHDALANLCQLFAATVGEDDVKLFKYHVRYDEKREAIGNAQSSRFTCRGTSISNGITATWITGAELGKAAAEQAIEAYNEHAEAASRIDGPHFINENPEGRTSGTGKGCCE